MYVLVLPRRAFRCLVETSLNFLLVFMYGLKLFTFRLKIMKKFKGSLACRLKNFWRMLNQDGFLWIQLYSERWNSLMVLNTTSMLMSLENNHPLSIIKHTKRSLIKSNIKIFWPKFTLLEQLLIYSINFLCCSKITCVTSFFNNGKISKARFMSSWLQNSYIVTELHVLTNYIMKTLFLVKIVKLPKWKNFEWS